MAKFTDNENREWEFSLDVYLLDRVIERTKVPIHKLLADDAKVMKDLADDPVLIVRVLWVLVEDNAKQRGVSPESFGRSIAGDCLGAAADALLEAIADFCPSHHRKLLRAMMAKGAELQEKQSALAMLKLDRATEESLRKLETIAAENSTTSKSSPTNSPDTSASTPAVVEG